MASWLGTLAASGPWTVNQWSNSQVRITAGTGAGQVKTIASNTATALTVSAAWGTGQRKHRHGRQPQGPG